MTAGKIFCENIHEPVWNSLPDYSISPAIDLWRISIKHHKFSKDQYTPLLSREERLKVKRYHQQRDKLRFTLGKGLLRLILSRYLGRSPEKIQFGYGINNKPFVKEGANLQFNVSYSHNYVMIAISSEPVGVDIEYINPAFDYPMVMESCFMREEIQVIQQDLSPQKVFFQSWTRKEALLKATSLGLDDYLRDFSCLDGMQELPKKFGQTGNWRIKTFVMEQEYQVSIAQEQLQTIRYCKDDLLPGIPA